MTKRDKVTVDEVIGLIHTDKPTDSVEEVRKLRGRENKTEKRYYYKDYEEAYYVFDSKTLSESEFEEKVEYYGYNVFADSLTGEEVIDLLNELNDENENFQHKLSQQEMEYATDLHRLSEENEQLKLLSNYRGEMVSFATSLIQDMGSEEMLKMWNNFTEVMYQKWKKKRGIK